MNVFNEDGYIDSDVQDILYELGNVGLGMASITMGNLMGVRMHIGVPVVEPADKELKALLDESNNKVAIVMEFQKNMSGLMVFLLDKSFITDIAERMYKDEIVTSEEEKSEALLEFANLVCAAYLKALGQYTEERFYVKPSGIFVADIEEVIEEKLGKLSSNCERVICVEAGFDVKTEGGETLKDIGNVIMLPVENSVARLVEPLFD